MNTDKIIAESIAKDYAPKEHSKIKALKKLMGGKENPSEMEKLLVELCDKDGDFTDKSAIKDLIEYVGA